MPQCRHHAAGFAHLGGIDRRGDEPDILAGIGQDLAPGSDDQGMAVSFAALRMLTGLGWREPVSMARARRSTCQWAWPVGRVKAAGTVMKLDPARASAR